MQFTHTSKQCFTSFLIRCNLQRCIRFCKASKSIDEFGQIFHWLWFNGYRNYRLRIVTNSFVWNEFFVCCDCDTCGCWSNTGDCSNVACNHLGDWNAIPSDHHAHLLDTFSLACTNSPNRFPVVDWTRVKTTYSDLTSMRVHPDFCNHHSKRTVGVTREHGLAFLRFHVTSPNIGDSVRLRLNRVGQLGHCHIE